MATRIWKYALPTRSCAILLPDGARVLSVQAQHEALALWAVVDDQAPRVPRRFEVFETGEKIADPKRVLGEYVGSVQLDNGAYVLHIFCELGLRF